MKVLVRIRPGMGWWQPSRGSKLGPVLRARPGQSLQTLVFFTAFYLYLWRIVEPHLLFHGAGAITDFPAFYTGWQFLREHLSYPGGPASYLSAFLSQSFCDSRLGALVVTFQAWATYRCIAYLLGQTGRPELRLAGYVPALLLAILYGRYTYHFPTTMAMLMALAFACLYIAVARRSTRPWMSPALFIILSLASYHVLGGAFLLFASVCAGYEWMIARGWRLPLVYAVVGAVLPYIVGTLGFDVSGADAYTRLLPISWRVRHYVERSRFLTVACALYLLPLALMGAGGVGLLRRARLVQDTGGAHRPLRRPRLRWLAQTLALLALGAAAGWADFDPRTKCRFAVDYYAYHRNWAEVLTAGRRHPDNRFVMHAVNRALYHTGRLGDEMFRWPQEPENLFLLGTGHDWVHWQSFDLHLELGLVNRAEHSLMECLEKLGDRPMILQRLALVHLVKGDLGTARIYLRALSRTLSHRRWARHYITLLEGDPNLSTDEPIQRLRSLAIEKDFPLLDLSREQLLAALLERNAQNRMAFEYLMAWRLLNGQLAALVQDIQGFKEREYRQLPIHFEEAVLLYVHGTKRVLDAGGYSPRVGLQKRLGHVVGILDQHRGNKQAARAGLAKYHRDTYFFYYLYLRPGLAEQRTAR